MSISCIGRDQSKPGVPVLLIDRCANPNSLRFALLEFLDNAPLLNPPFAVGVSTPPSSAVPLPLGPTPELGALNMAKGGSFHPPPPTPTPSPTE